MRHAPKMRQYHANGRSFPLSKKRIAGPMIASPATNDAPNPIKQEEREIGNCVVCKEALRRVSALPPRIVGMAKRKENRTASSAFQPRIRAQDIVEALREIPGMSAADCKTPMQSASCARLCQAIEA